MVDILKLAEQFEVLAKLDPKAEVRNRGTVCVPASSAKDKKDHFPINNAGQARNALARVHQYSKAPSWYKGSLESLQNLVSRKVHSKYPSIKSQKKSYLQLFLIRYAAELNLQNMTPHDAAHILDVSMPITLVDLKKAYRKKVVDNHPDRNPLPPSWDKDPSDELKKINRAFEVLSKEVARLQPRTDGPVDETDFDRRIRVRDKTNNGEHHRGFNFGKYSLSIQASYSHYCDPREDLPSLADYDKLEIAIIDNTAHELVDFYRRYNVLNNNMPDDLADMPGIEYFASEQSVGAYVPKYVVKQIFEFLRSRFGLISEL